MMWATEKDPGKDEAVHRYVFLAKYFSCGVLNKWHMNYGGNTFVLYAYTITFM